MILITEEVETMIRILMFTRIERKETDT